MARADINVAVHMYAASSAEVASCRNAIVVPVTYCAMHQLVFSLYDSKVATWHCYMRVTNFACTIECAKNPRCLDSEADALAMTGPDMGCVGGVSAHKAAPMVGL